MNDISSAEAKFGPRAERTISRFACRAGGVLVAILAALAGGCQDQPVPEQGIGLLGGEANLADAIRAERPVLVDFYKAGCPTCRPGTRSTATPRPSSS